eukprot:TRINITY_DN20677_c0_g2_i2.p1 TRINITY_DN20677_c0_g2~~TRINITY_DN20677_c0_g2_i2.p1  ORF type:complete len:527 (+),score=129.83 TRINITY_DN20677_c0_g2_i2:689-2269(+)
MKDVELLRVLEILSSSPNDHRWRVQLHNINLTPAACREFAKLISVKRGGPACYEVALRQSLFELSDDLMMISAFSSIESLYVNPLRLIESHVRALMAFVKQLLLQRGNTSSLRRLELSRFQRSIDTMFTPGDDEADDAGQLDSSLVDLDLNWCGGFHQANALGRFITNSSKLQRISLRECVVNHSTEDGGALKHIINGLLQSKSSIQELELIELDLKLPNLKHLTRLLLSEKNNLVSLKIASNIIVDNFDLLMEGFQSSSSHLQKLYIDVIQCLPFSDEATIAIGEWLKTNQELLVLEMNNVLLTLEFVEILASAFASDTCNLESFTSSGGLMDQRNGFKALFNGLAHNAKLKHLGLNNLEMTNSDIKVICKSLKTNANLLSLSLAWNGNLTNDSLFYIADCLQVNKGLQFMDLTGTGIDVSSPGCDCSAFYNESVTCRVVLGAPSPWTSSSKRGGVRDKKNAAESSEWDAQMRIKSNMQFSKLGFEICGGVRHNQLLEPQVLSIVMDLMRSTWEHPDFRFSRFIP